MKIIVVHCLAACIFMTSCSRCKNPGHAPNGGSPAVKQSAESPGAKQGLSPAAAEEAFKKLFDGFEGILPEGWAVTVKENPGAPGGLWMKTVVFIYFKSDCTVHFGAGSMDTRKEHANLTLFFYRIEDRKKLAAIEDPYRELSSHCPMDADFAVTQEFFIARSPCDRAFSTDESCNPPVEKLEKALLEHFGKKVQ